MVWWIMWQCKNHCTNSLAAPHWCWWGAHCPWADHYKCRERGFVAPYGPALQMLPGLHPLSLHYGKKHLALQFHIKWGVGLESIHCSAYHTLPQWKAWSFFLQTAIHLTLILLCCWSKHRYDKTTSCTTTSSHHQQLTLSILFATSILIRSFLVAYVSSSFSHTSRPSKLCLELTS